MTIESVGIDAATNRELLLLRYSPGTKFPTWLNNNAPHFVCMLVWNANDVGDDEILKVSGELIESGCVYLCCWGNDCERVHDLFDDRWLELGFDEKSDDTIMTTWHADDTLEEFVTYAIANTVPTVSFVNQCRSVVAVVVENEWAESRIRKMFLELSKK